MPTIRFTIKVNNLLTDPDSVVLEDTAGTYGVKRNDTDAVIAAAGTAMDKVSTGIYEYAFDDPGADLIYGYYVKYVLNGATYYSEGVIAGTASSGLDELLEDTREVLEDSSKAIFADSSVIRAVNTAILAASVYVP